MDNYLIIFLYSSPKGDIHTTSVKKLYLLSILIIYNTDDTDNTQIHNLRFLSFSWMN